MKDKGISLITLIVTIMVMIILVTIIGIYAVDTINQGSESVNKNELASVREFVLTKQVIVTRNNYEDEAIYEAYVIDAAEIQDVCKDKLDDEQINDIIEVNSADIDLKYKYLYVKAKEKPFENIEFTKDNITIQDVKNDYIVNFYTATVIALYNKEAKVDGVVKGLDTIFN